MKIKSLVMVLCLTVLLSGCVQNTQDIVKEDTEVVIPVSFLVNPDTGENENEGLVEEFNKAYQGKYRIQVEWITDTAEGYRSRIKTMNGLDKLPAIITDVRFDEDFYHLLAENHRLVDLEPYIEKDEAWMQAFDEREQYLEDGTCYLSPGSNTSQTYGGFYYNKELFAQAGIRKFPESWEEFFECLDTLKAKKITPLAIHGGSSYWTSLLISTGYIAQTGSGMDFLEEQYPKSYENESASKLFSMLKRLYEYADQDAVEIERIESARRFTQGEAAITANGGWMIQTFTKAEKNRTGFAPFPGNILLQDSRMSAWAVTAGYSREVTDGAAEFLKFRAIRDQKQEEAYFAQEAETEVEKEYKQVVLAADTQMPNYQLKWETRIQEEFLANFLPSYILGEISLPEFLKELDGAVAEINEEK